MERPQGHRGGEDGAAGRRRERRPASAGFSLKLVVDNPTKMPPGDSLGGICIYGLFLTLAIHLTR
ncbi:MAG TPA: hypothetical protein VGQ99_19005 [Tepidisphaeraceae bacterium]|nr:hypothetical protein [Tepidisphaeraceae bacterium]